MSISVGKKIKDFTVASSSGLDFKLSELKSKAIVLYFYPKDNTPGCTLESQQFNKNLAKFKKLDVSVYGISRDNLKSHDKFIDQCELKFELLSDADEIVCKIFDVIKEKNMYGKKVLGIERSTFLIAKDGTLLAEWRKVKADGHADEVLDKCKELL